ncbi:hypothetical protein K435DRAFT_315356 [Dendrothele bispora CBS 962.96]|uniref:Uncharacterized protein n=1 Tax=Dendrothele bispora (strain CBS 962.96) TaxID=1314807 RepID=A0A4S8LGX0_DENBC|nr:hypothetical protein K435DRAFT_315356 [Dendrothele bispora CBS 962.96]
MCLTIVYIHLCGRSESPNVHRECQYRSQQRSRQRVNESVPCPGTQIQYQLSRRWCGPRCNLREGTLQNPSH